MSIEKSVIDLLNNLKKNNSDIKTIIFELNKFKDENSRVVYNSKNGSYSVGNYYIVPGYVSSDAEFLKNLGLLNKNGLCKTSAPEVVDVVYLAQPEIEFCVVVYKLNGTNGGSPIPYIEALNEVSLDKKQVFYKEQEMLLEKLSLYNSDLFESYSSWAVFSDSQNIYVDSWASLEKCVSSEEKAKLLMKLKEMLK